MMNVVKKEVKHASFALFLVQKCRHSTYLAVAETCNAKKCLPTGLVKPNKLTHCWFGAFIEIS